jgi:hypothetical protein
MAAGIVDAMSTLPRIPTDIHKAISLLLDYMGSQEYVADDGELEDAWNLLSQWWKEVPVGGESGVDPYPGYVSKYE